MTTFRHARLDANFIHHLGLVVRNKSVFSMHPEPLKHMDPLETILVLHGHCVLGQEETSPTIPNSMHFHIWREGLRRGNEKESKTTTTTVTTATTLFGATKRTLLTDGGHGDDKRQKVHA